MWPEEERERWLEEQRQNAIATWQPIDTAPKEGHFLITDYEEGEAWPHSIELVIGPIRGNRVMCQNSGNYLNTKTYTHWMLLPPAPFK